MKGKYTQISSIELNSLLKIKSCVKFNIKTFILAIVDKKNTTITCTNMLEHHIDIIYIKSYCSKYLKGCRKIQKNNWVLLALNALS